MAIIYKIYNDINDNVYIGETIRTLEQRWKQHKINSQDLSIVGHLQLAMRKYGLENFHIEEIEKCADEKRFERERYWIEYYNSYYNGYNATLGGEGKKNYDYRKIYELWEEGTSTKEIMKKLGCCNTTIQAALKKYGIQYIDYINRTFAKPVLQYSRDGIFIREYKSINEAGKALGLVNGTNIGKCCRGEIKTSKGYIWKYKEDPTSIEELVKNKKKNTTGKIVQQFTLDNILLNTYNSCEEAGKALGKKSGSCINRCARGERSTAYGYIWKYKGE